MTPTTPPGTPGDTQTPNETIAFILARLSSDWDINLLLPGEKTSTNRELTWKQKKCFEDVKLLTYKKQIAPVLLNFEMAALSLYNGWVNKPKADRGMPLPTKERPRPMTNYEREQLMDCFLAITELPTKRIKEDLRTRGSRSRGTSRKIPEGKLDDTTIELKLPISERGGAIDESSESNFKRTKLLEVERDQLAGKQTLGGSNNTSFASLRNLSVTESFGSSCPPSLFENEDNHSRGRLVLTQETVPDNLPNSSNYGSTPTGNFDQPVDPAMFSFDGNTSFTSVIKPGKQDLTSFADPAITKLQESLCGIFPTCKSPSFLDAPFYFQYEILRVFLHTGVSIYDEMSLPRRLNYGEYERLWSYLRNLPAMKGKPFPPRTKNTVWNSLMGNTQLGSRAIVMSGILQFLPVGPLFQLRLRPLQLDLSHRLERRFGSYRFFEIDIPNLSSPKVPKALQDLGSIGRSILIDWLLNKHDFIGKVWAIFSNKPWRIRDRKKKKSSIQSDLDNNPTQRLFFFAINGNGFSPNKGTPSLKSPESWTVYGLLNWLRPAEENMTQPYLKLYARTLLALSRNAPTVKIDETQVRYKDDIKVAKEDMTDGAGRLSHALAMKIAVKLGLEYLPSGFQARFGEAKGFWSIDPSTTNVDEEWIEIYKSQQKWAREKPEEDPDYTDDAHWIFEVNNKSDELRSKDLPSQLLPILIDRAVDKSTMIDVIEKLLIKDLIETIQAQRIAMRNPLSCREWVQDTNCRLNEKVKLGATPFAAGLPIQLGDRMNMLLDAGFNPETCNFLREMCEILYRQKCDTLRGELKIHVARSTYAFMVPDFSGLLEPDEIFIHLSRNIGPSDTVFARSGCPLQQMEMLVARCPAHFASDIQKVKAVVKTNLLGLQDVIVFSTKGYPSLAQKLSGGDYDGDTAWICWEKAIVENFRNAEVPVQPKLVEEGFIEKVSTTYEELVGDKASDEATTIFLKKSLEFNLEQSMLGICTSFKDDFVYAYPDLRSPRLIYLATLLSYLVDEAKQGYIFKESHWQRFKKDALTGVKLAVPLYKQGGANNDIIRFSCRPENIMDRLKYVAQETIDKVLTEFHQDLPKALYWDDDLAKLSDWVYNEAGTDPEWLSILKKLKDDIAGVKALWDHYNRKDREKKQKEEERTDFALQRDDCFEKFRAIKPKGNTPLTRVLLGHSHSGFSQWALVKASVIFTSYRRSYVANLVWWVAAPELCFLKAQARGSFAVMTPEMYAMQKPDSRYVRMRMAEMEGRIDEGSVFGDAEDDVLNDAGEDEEDDVILLDD